MTILLLCCLTSLISTPVLVVKLRSRSRSILMTFALSRLPPWVNILPNQKPLFPKKYCAQCSLDLTTHFFAKNLILELFLVKIGLSLLIHSKLSKKISITLTLEEYSPMPQVWSCLAPSSPQTCLSQRYSCPRQSTWNSEVQLTAGVQVYRTGYHSIYSTSYHNTLTSDSEVCRSLEHKPAHWSSPSSPRTPLASLWPHLNKITFLIHFINRQSWKEPA